MYVLILLLSLLTAPPQEPINKNIATKNETHPFKANTQSKPAPSVPSNTPNDEPKTRSNSDQDQSTPNDGVQRIELVPQSDWWFKGYVIATLVIAALNFGMLVTIRHQRDAMREQLKAMQDERAQQDRLIKLEHRAWMKFWKVDFTITPQHYINLLISFTNVGRTPARDFHAWMFLETVPRNADPDLFYEKDKNVPASPVVPPDSPLTFPLAGELLTDATHANIMKGGMRVMFHGKITYKDIFEEHHWLTFCQEYDPNVGRFMIYKRHNEADY
ncbi:MAG TPA: hypothetical protein VGJ33_01530 [Candidatus Angelobacter sp.]|jgi:hypothetical protein